MKAKYTISIIILISFFIVGGVWLNRLSAPNSDKSVNLSAEPIYPPETNSNLNESGSARLVSELQSDRMDQMDQATPVATLSAIEETVSVGGLTAEIRSVDLKQSEPAITLCADLPTVADWLPRFSAVYQGQKVLVRGWMLLDPDNTAYLAKNRCYLVKLSNELFTSETSAGTLTFSLDSFESSLPEKIPADVVAEAQAALKDTGIKFELQDVPHSQTIIIISKPESTSQEEATQKVQEAIESTTDKVYGPWIFTIDLDKQ